MKPLLVACGFVIAGCSRDEVSSTAITSAPLEVPAEAEELADLRLTRRVEAAVALDPTLSTAARNVEVTATDGVVSLTGSVDDTRAKERIERTALTVAGVEETLDKVEVAPARDLHREESDETIAYSLQRSLAFDPDVADDAERVTIEVVKGKVTLRGTTEERTTATFVENIAASTPGVTAVDNRLVSFPRSP